MPAKIIVTPSTAASLDPLRRVLSELPADLDAAVIVVQHRAATAGTLLAKMLRAVTPLRVVSVDGQQVIEAGGVYVLPPDRESWLPNEGLIAAPIPHGSLRRHSSLERVIESAVAAYGPDVIGMQLAGGCGWTQERAALIRHAGGEVVAQDDSAPGWLLRPARADAVPGITVLPVSEIGYFLCRLVDAGAARQRLTGVS